MGLLANLISLVIDIYIFIIILQVLIHWLIIFDVINVKNAQAQNLVDLLKRATEPVFEKVRKYVPPIGGIDLTPLVVIIGLQILKYLLFVLLF